MKVTFVEFPVLSGVVPLASGYMEATCLKDRVISESFDFVKLSLHVKAPYSETLSILERSSADIYAFSCYVWNSGLVRRLVDSLLETQPSSYFVLGGPQVMHQADKYLRPQHESVFVCNGEGERTFANFLRTTLSPERDFSRVHNLSFYKDNKLVTTEPEPRINDLSEIPSPFLEGLFEDGSYTWMLIETNRGCPFKCNYCYWGAATGAKVYRYDDHRIEQELTWIAKSRCCHLFIADANWGMLQRDVNISRFIAECREKYGAPLSVYFCGAKNKPDRVAEITRIFHQAGLVSSQSISLQTMNPETLKRVNRDNIRLNTYTALQQSLNTDNISSFIEIIWPLPGETLASFQEGLAKLCEIGAEAFIVYPLLLMNNVELNDKREEYGLVTVADPDPNSEAEIVVATNEVDVASHQEGIRYAYAVTSLYSLRGLWCLARYLNKHGIVSYAQLFRNFVAFCKGHPDHCWSRFCEESIRRVQIAEFSNTGALVHVLLHENRAAFDELLSNFVVTQEFWRDRTAQCLFEVDLLNRPYIYLNTSLGITPYQFVHLRIVEKTRGGYLVEAPLEFVAILNEYLSLEESAGISLFEVNYRRSQLPFMRRKSMYEHFLYCQDASQRIGHMLPSWRCRPHVVGANEIPMESRLQV